MSPFLLSFVIYGILLLSIRSIEGQYLQSTTCSWGCYLANYVDLQNAFGCDFKAAENHYNQWGKKEGRDCTCNKCNWQCYLDRYQDLKNAFGSDPRLAENHWNNHGKSEGRDCKCECNWQCYLDRYQDLKNAYNCDLNAAKNHWSSSGKRENRNCQCASQGGSITESGSGTSNQPPKCPAGSQQVGSLGADIHGCGMEGCNARYQDKYPDIDSCNKGCRAKSNCKAFSWAPMNDDPNHPGKSACTLYDIDAPTSSWGKGHQIFCKMLPPAYGSGSQSGQQCENGGTEELILRLKTCSDGNFFSPTIKNTGIENPSNPQANTYSIIGQLDKNKYKDSNNQYEFRLKYKTKSNTDVNLKWKQSSWLIDTFGRSGVCCDSAPGFQEISFIPPQQANGDDVFHGLGKSTYSQCYLDGTSLGPDWFNCVGAISGWGGNYIAGYNRGQEISEELYVCKPIDYEEQRRQEQEKMRNQRNELNQNSVNKMDESFKKAEEESYKQHQQCENGGTEELILKLGTTTGGNFFSSTIKNTGIENPSNPQANTYSIIGQLDKNKYKDSNNQYEFRLKYRTKSNTDVNLKWKQSSWLTDTFGRSGVCCDDAPGFQQISFIPAQQASGDDVFHGLGKSTYSQCYLDGTSLGPDWFNCVGAISGWGGNYIAGYNRGQETSEELYVCKPIDYGEQRRQEQEENMNQMNELHKNSMNKMDESFKKAEKESYKQHQQNMENMDKMQQENIDKMEESMNKMHKQHLGAFSNEMSNMHSQHMGQFNDMMHTQREEFGNHIGRIKDQLISEMQEGFKQHKDKNTLLNKINDIQNQQSQLEFEHKMFNEQKNSKKELNKKTEEIEQQQSEWEEEQAKIREERLEKRKKMMEERHEMRMDEHAQLMNGLKGFLTAFQNMWQDNLNKEKNLKPALPVHPNIIHRMNRNGPKGMNGINRINRMSGKPAIGFETKETNVDYNRPPPLLPPIPPLPPPEQKQ